MSLLRRFISSEETKFHHTLGEQSLLEKVSKGYNVKMGWLASVMTAINIGVFLIFMCYSIREKNRYNRINYLGQCRFPMFNRYGHGKTICFDANE
ncbi:MAG: hypothetical protein ACI9SG_000895 [Maribacter sp.]|jgi:hypothetical protein